MDFKRIASALIGFPGVVLVLVFANNYITDIAISIVAVIAIQEFYNAVAKESKPIRWLGYLACITIAFIHIIQETMPAEYIESLIIISIPSLVLILFLHVIISKMKINFKDIAYTAFGVIYIALFIMFLALIRGLENGKILIWYVFFSAWATDVFAYFVGKYLGKHKFSEISPKKTIEGCIGGIFGAVIVTFVYTYCINNFLAFEYSYIYIGIITAGLSIISQIGDFAASTIKRYVGIKDYSELIPGHGGMLDRIDSLLFIAPFAYVLFTMLQL